ncbi:DUF1127 domain-containing protein [Acidocella sp.]|uniref:DUF1127 domain-containing protein n=1 Tax=Acidocella sp. TaxID=50710 RepID=UPI002632234B|nr:DUF1127 domain-containing protein [Acidocella sp.]
MFTRLRALRTHLALMAACARGRQALAGMDARMLSDIGLSRAEALEEARRPFWDLAERSCETAQTPRRPRGLGLFPVL